MHLIKLSISAKEIKRPHIPFTMSHTPLVTEMFNEQKEVKPGIKFPSWSATTCLFCCVFIFSAPSSHHHISCLAVHAWALSMQQVRAIQTTTDHTREWHLDCFEEKRIAVLQLWVERFQWNIKQEH